MSKVLITESYLDAIADAIRGKNGTQNTYTPAQMAAAVQAISTGSNIPVLLMVTTQPTKKSYDAGDELDLTGIVVTATYSDGTTANVTSSCTFSPADGDTLSTVGTQTITATYTVTDTSTGHNYTLTLTATTTVTVESALTIVSWASGSDADVAAMIDAARAGTIDLQQDGGWAVGDVRTIHIDAFTGGGNVSHSAQDCDIVITSFDDYMNCGNVLQFDFKGALEAGNRINSSDTNAGGYGATEMKTITLPALVDALPEWLRTRLIEFSVLVSEGGASSVIETVSGNKLALRSEIEILPSLTYSPPGEGFHVPYYNSNERRTKVVKSSGITSWWTRSPWQSLDVRFVAIAGSSSATISSDKNTIGVSPFGCL